MFRSFLRRAVPALFASTLLACGGGSDDSGTPPATTPTPEVPTATANIAIAPATLTVVAGGSGSATVTLTRGGGFAGAVTLVASGAPAEVAIAAPAIAADATTATVTIDVASAAAAGDTTVTFTGTAEGVTIAPVTLALTVQAAPAGVTPLGSGIVGEAAYDESGHALALSADGTRVAIGAWINDGANGTDSGHVRVYQRSGTTWVQVGDDIDGEAANDRSGTSVAMSADGSRVVIGAYLNGINFSAAGQARVYELVAGAWTQIGADIDGGYAQGLGFAVAMSADGRRILVGAPGVNNTNGYARVYEQSGSDWLQVGADIDEASTSEFGQAVDISDDGNRVAIGAPGANATTRPGTTYVYQWNGTAWAALGAPIAGEALGDTAGTSVSLSADGNRLAVGAPANRDGGDSGDGFPAGQVRIYAFNGTAWAQLGGDVDGQVDTSGGDYFGSAVALSGDGERLIASGPNNSVARIYTLSNGAWVQTGTDLAGPLALGVAISTDGHTAAVGFNYFQPSAIGQTQVYSVTP